MTPALNSRRPPNLIPRAGFTLIELVVTILIIGVLTAIAAPQYIRTVETAKADDAVATVNMIGIANKMFALSHNGNYVHGAFAAACDAGACPTTGPYANACDLVYCKYLADQNWEAKPYKYYACNGTPDPLCQAGATATARRTGATATPYSDWKYNVERSGVITPFGGAPAPTY